MCVHHRDKEAGQMECWNIGIMENWEKLRDDIPITHDSN
jgi:hypothetical protein